MYIKAEMCGGGGAGMSMRTHGVQKMLTFLLFFMTVATLMKLVASASPLFLVSSFKVGRSLF